MSIIYKISSNIVIHFIGIGGIGMSGIAEILVHEGCSVTGSDIIRNKVINRLLELGVKIFFGHKLNNIYHADIVVVSNAITEDNPEVVAAKKKNSYYTTSRNVV